MWGEFVSHHGGKTRSAWSKMQCDIWAGNRLIGENSISERCFVSGRGSQPSGMGLPRSQLTLCCWDTNCVQFGKLNTANIIVSKKGTYNVVYQRIRSCPSGLWFCSLNSHWITWKFSPTDAECFYLRGVSTIFFFFLGGKSSEFVTVVIVRDHLMWDMREATYDIFFSFKRSHTYLLFHH